MENENRYAPPESELVTPGGSNNGELAERGTRLGAAIIDGIIGLVVALPMMYLMGFHVYIMAGEQAPIGLTLSSMVMSLVFFVLLHGYFLYQSGQTIGKKLLSIKIVNLEGNVPSLGKLLGLRYLPVMVVSSIPLLGGIASLVDILFIFRQDRRCVHDLIAGTRVVAA